MRRQIAKYSRDFAAIVMIALVAFVVAGYILAHQRFYLPSWVPVLGKNFVTLKGEFRTAKAVTPGQGQTVDIAGVPVGQITGVELVGGRAVVTMQVKERYGKQIYRDASMLLRPKTGLDDMVVALDPGHAGAGVIPDGFTVPVKNTMPNVELDEILAKVDADSRDYLKLLLGGAGEGLRGQGRELSSVLRRIDPLSRDTEKVFAKLAERRENLRRLVGNFQALATEVGSRDKQLAALVKSSDSFFAALGRQDARLREALGLLPDTLDTTRVALGKADTLARTMGPTLESLRPGARALGPALEATQPFFRKTTPVIEKQLRPFTRAAVPTVRDLRPAAADLSALSPKLVKTFQILNYALNELAYNPPGKEEGYLFWMAWVNHAGNTVFSTQDAHGPIRRGLLLLSCSTLGLLQQAGAVNPALGTLVGLLNPPSQGTVCPKSIQPVRPGSGG
jgi:phospholipid/cholesterol/gamma-HCH transport system substrate-binding protein